MSIEPKYNPFRSEREYIASKEFTDREEPRESFWENYDKLLKNKSHQDKYHILNFYGVGGIGKTSLINELKKEIEEFDKTLIYTDIDFDHKELLSRESALLQLSLNIKNRTNNKIQFNHFNVAYSIWFKKSNPDMTYNEKSIPFFKEIDLAADLVGVIDSIGVISGVANAVNALYKLGRKLKLDKKMKKPLLELDTIDPSNMLERLIFCFSYDIKRFLDTYNNHNLVVFIDTYEKLFSNSNLYQREKRDSWVRELISYLPRILFVIVGREKLEWGQYNNDWFQHIDSHILGNLDEKSSYNFLEKCGLTEKNIIERIIKSSKGHPYYLDLQVDTYFEIKNNNEVMEIEQFAENKREILDCFLEHLDNDEIELLKIISIPRFYDRDIFDYLIKEFNMSYDFTRFKEFSSYSFVKADNDINYFIHDLMREELKTYLINRNELKLIRKIQKKMFLYYEKKFNQEKVLSYNEKKIFLSEEIYHKFNSSEDNRFLEWLKNNRLDLLTYFQLQGEVFFLSDIINLFINDIDYSNIDIEIFNIIADIIHLGGNYRESVEISNEYLLQYEEYEILNDNELLYLKARSYHHQMFYEPIDKLMNKVMQLENKIDRNKFPKSYNEVLKVIGNLCVLNGDFDASREWIDRSIKHSNENGYTDYFLRTVRKKIDILRVDKKYDIAEAECMRAINISIEENFERYQLYLKCSLAEIYRSKGLHSKCLDVLEEAEATVKKLGIKGWEAHVYLAFGNIYNQMDEIDKALNYIKKAEKIYKKLDHRWGLINVSLLKLLNDRVSVDKIPKILNAINDCNYERKILNDYMSNKFYNYDLLFV